MPVQVQGPDGNTYQFPDGTDKTAAIAYFKKKGIGAPKSTAPQKSFVDALTEIQPHQPVHSAADLGREVERGVGNIGAGGLGVILHPVNTLESIGGMFTAPIEMATGTPFKETVPGQALKSLKEHPLETVESGIGQAGVMGAGELAAEGIPKVGGKVARALTKTGPKETAELVKETKAANEAATAKAAEETAKQQAKHEEDVSNAEEKRNLDLKKHFKKTSEAKQANEATEGRASRKAAVGRGVERLDTEVRADVDKVEENVNTEANKKYNDLRKVLKDEKADSYQQVDEEGHLVGKPVTMVEHLYDVASEPLRGTETETPIIKSLAKRTGEGDVELTYNDLQGYREEVGRELRKGTLPPDVFTAYKNLMGAIDDAMGKIAERKGLKPQQDAARAYWRQYADLFLDRDSLFRKWKTAAESPNYKPGMGPSFIKNADTGIQALAKFDKDVARRVNNLRTYGAEAKAPLGPQKLQSLPKLAPKEPTPPAPTPVQPELKTIGAEDVQAKKLNSLQEKGVPGVRKVGHRIVNYGIGLHALWDAFSGRIADLPRDVGLGAAGYGATEAFARLLERPDIQEMLSRPTEADIAQIPPELRGNLGPMLDAAKAKGIKVDPRLYAVAAAPQRKRVAAALAPAQ